MDKKMTPFQRNKAAGLCGTCGKVPPRPGKATCEACAKKRSERDKYYREYLIKMHHCCSCGKPLPKDWYYVECAECKEWMSAYDKKRRQQLKQEGRCPGCGKPIPPDQPFQYCPKCRQERHLYYKPRKTTNALRFQRLFGMTAEELRFMSDERFKAWAEGGRP